MNNSFSHSSAVGVWPGQLNGTSGSWTGHTLCSGPSMAEETEEVARGGKAEETGQTDKVTEDTKPWQDRQMLYFLCPWRLWANGDGICNALELSWFQLDRITECLVKAPVRCYVSSWKVFPLTHCRLLE